MKHENLNGRVAVVTGGGGVLCGDFSKVLAKQGVKVAVLDLNEAAAQKVVDEITADGGTAIAVGCNVLDPESMLIKKFKHFFDISDNFCHIYSGCFPIFFHMAKSSLPSR